MGNSSSQEAEARRSGGARHHFGHDRHARTPQPQQQQQQHQQQQQAQQGGQQTSAIRPISSAGTDPRSPSHDASIPAVPFGFDQRPTTSVSRESAVGTSASTASTPSRATGNISSGGSFAHVEMVTEQATPPPQQQQQQEQPQRPSMAAHRRKSMILLDEATEDDEAQRLRVPDDMQPLSRAGSGEEIDLTSPSDQETEKYETVIEWKQGGSKVYVTGSFTSWRRMIKLTPADKPGEFSTVLRLPPGTHRLRFVVDHEMRCSDLLPTATDSMGNLVNYIEVGILSDDEEDIRDDQGTRYERFTEADDAALHEPELQYGSDIPPVFTDPEVMDRFVSSDFVTPPHLPPHLESVILNSDAKEKDNNSVLPIPNHVVLNHLATTSIKHNVLAVASISRYSRKYVTQILYAPL